MNDELDEFRIAETKRTYIDIIRLDDAQFFVELLNSPGWLHYIGNRGVNTVSDAETFLTNGLLKSYGQNGFSYYLVKTKEKIPFGVCGFMKKPYLQNEDFGFAYLPEYQGRGFGYEAGEAILRYGVKQYGFKQLDAVTMSSNTPSIGLLTKIGFERIGTVEPPDSQEVLELYRWCQ